ncbi:MAG TPA: M50 family metallopeptidase [Acidimicrobiales bacterium]|nr:M50 family metallopeptidase [Acidimicrobiales bacterium]
MTVAQGRPAPAVPTPPPDPGPAPADPRLALARLVAVVAAVVALCVAAHVTAVLIVVVALVVMVMLHELGHLLTAKLGHMKVTEYFLGFGPKLWSIRRGETEYGIKAIPAGGYVKILGMTSAEEVDPADEARTYRQQPFHNRLLVAVAGSAMHAVMAFVLLWGMFVFFGAPQGNAVAITALAPFGHGLDPARAAGLRPGDVVTSVDGRAVRSATDLQKAIEDHSGVPLTVVVERGGAARTFTVTPAADHTGTTTTGHIGVEIGPPVLRSNPAAAVPAAGRLFGRIVSGTIGGFGQVFSASGIAGYFHDLTNAQAAAHAAKTGDRISSIYGAGRIAVESAKVGAYDLIDVLASIIIIVGMINLFPMLPLDGGHVLVAVYERIRSRRGRPYHADVTKLTPVAYAFVLLLGFIVVSALYLDITHPVSLQ